MEINYQASNINLTCCEWAEKHNDMIENSIIYGTKPAFDNYCSKCGKPLKARKNGCLGLTINQNVLG